MKLSSCHCRHTLPENYGLSQTYRTKLQKPDKLDNPSRQPRLLPSPHTAARRTDVSPFHTYGITYQLYVYLPLAHVATAVLFPPRSVSDPHAAPIIPTSDNIIDCIKRRNARSSWPCLHSYGTMGGV
ncbi:hypothetical protein F5I97DRAFT_51810 [Phlebopus sp. FC_14]|nr:hypothetical protein F5I97DRAFT_51810 [Phlebopus sp. FC_14]